ncbi:hypothetical protein ABZP36_024986 [Zizania latifolia]
MADDGGSSSAASYIRLVHHLIEMCICYNMNMEECMETLEKNANIKPVITATVWKELEKENREFFETYNKGREDEHKSSSPGQEAAAGSKSSGGGSGGDE